LLKLTQVELGELLSKRLQPKIQNLEVDKDLGPLEKEENPENVFALTYDYNYHSRYAKRLRVVVAKLADAWASHDPQIINRNPKPLADIIFLAGYIHVIPSPSVLRIMTEPKFSNIPTQSGETFADFKKRFPTPSIA